MQNGRPGTLQADLGTLLTSVSKATGLQRIELRGNTGITGPLSDDGLCTIVQVEVTSQLQLDLGVCIVLTLCCNLLLSASVPCVSSLVTRLVGQLLLDQSR